MSIPINSRPATYAVHPLIALATFVAGYLADYLYYRYSGASTWVAVAIITIVLSLLLPASVTATFTKRNTWRALLLGKPRSPSLSIYLLIATVLFVPAYICLTLILAHYWTPVRRVIFWDLREMREVVRTTPWYLVAPGGFFFAFTEEFMYRGFIMNSLRRWGITAAILISALCFAAAHHTIGKLIPMTIAGSWFAYVALRSGSIWVSSTSHFIVNAMLLGAAILYTSSSPSRYTPLPNPSPWWLLAILPSIVFGVWLIENQSRK